MGYNKVINDCMGIKKEESVLILTDDNKINIAQNLYNEARKITDNVYMTIMKPRDVNGEEPPEEIADFMRSVDVVIAPTTVSITHTLARSEASSSGTRIGSMPNITEDMFINGAINADFDIVLKLTEKLSKKLTKAKYARIEKDNKVLEFNLENRQGINSPGVYINKKEAGNIPSGEAFIAPVENSVNGEIIIDGSMVGIGLLENPLYMKIESGKIVELKGDIENKLDILFESEENHTIAELGIGTNPAARLTGIILEDEKVFGTVHIAFGTNTSFGGENSASCHLDGIILKPTLYLDDEIIIENGEFKINY